MNWRTEIAIDKANEWNHDTKIMTMGSCFAENMTSKLSYYLFETLVNPFGITFNPLSIANQLNQLQNNTQIDIKSLEKHDDRFFHFDFHSKFSSIDAHDTKANIHQSIAAGKQFLETADVLVLTFGSAFYYEHQTHGIVNNCHKIPSTFFDKKKATTQQMFEALKQPLQKWLHAKPNREVVVTVSPIRHWKDGVVANNRSKASLLLLAEELTAWNAQIKYFPSYEIVMDELRDYRFYKDDLLHPSDAAIDYIWEKLSEQRFSSIKETLNHIHKIQQAIHHRPFNPTGEKHQQFLRNTLHLLSTLKTNRVLRTASLETQLKDQLHDK